ncbi:MAG: FtsB family cell division protein [Flavobacteriales bacterium]
MQKFIAFLKNKYVYTSIIFLLWLTFLSDVDLIYIVQSRIELGHLRAEVSNLEKQNEEARTSLQDLTTNQASLEKFARENYLFKRENEDVYVIKEKKAIPDSTALHEESKK